MESSAAVPAEDPRRVRARATRRRMVEAAYGLFCERGFVVPMTAIASEAGVAVQTLYFTFHTKSALLREALQYAVHGDDLPLPPHERPWFGEMAAEADPRRAIAILMAGIQGVYERVGPLAGVFKTGEPEIAAMWRDSEELRHHGMSIMVAELMTKGRPRVDMSSAGDIVFVLLSPETFQSFVGDRGWTVERWRDWTAEALVALLFEPA